jgi:hypothetical protein
MASTAEVFATWLARPYDLHDENMQKLRNDVNARFDLFKFEVATMVSNSLQERPEFNELYQLLRAGVDRIWLFLGRGFAHIFNENRH